MMRQHIQQTNFVWKNKARKDCLLEYTSTDHIKKDIDDILVKLINVYEDQVNVLGDRAQQHLTPK